MLMWLGWDSVEATLTPFTVTMFWVILSAGKKTYKSEVWEPAKIKKRNMLHE